jgi:hypothetical protein
VKIIKEICNLLDFYNLAKQNFIWVIYLRHLGLLVAIIDCSNSAYENCKFHQLRYIQGRWKESMLAVGFMEELRKSIENVLKDFIHQLYLVLQYV